MPTASTPRRSPFAVWHWPRWVWFVIVPLVLLGYTLSIGPVAYLTVTGQIPESCHEILNVIYLPLMVACAMTPVTDAALNDYIQHWSRLGEM